MPHRREPINQPAKPPRRDLRRIEILDAAASLFYDKGYAGTSIQDIADAVGLLKGSLYYYFKSKDELLFDIVSDITQTAIDGIEAIRRLDTDSLGKLDQLVLQHVLSLGGNYKRVRVFFTDSRHLGAERYRDIVAQRRRYEEFVASLIEGGQREGSIAATDPPRVLAVAFLSMLNSFCLWYREDGPLSMDELALMFRNVVVGALVSRELPPEPEGWRRHS